MYFYYHFLRFFFRWYTAKDEILTPSFRHIIHHSKFSKSPYLKD